MLRKSIIGVLAIAAVAFAFWRVTHLRISEDIVEALPRSAQTEALTDILANFGFANKLVLSVSDRSGQSTPDDLIDIADHLADSLHGGLKPYLRSVLVKADFESMKEVQQAIVEYLPIFLTSADYSTLDSATSATAIATTLTNAWYQLLSPAGAFTKDQLVTDPLGFSYLPLKQLGAYSQGSEYCFYRNYVFSADTSVLLIFADPLYNSSETRKNEVFVNELNKTIGAVKEVRPSAHISVYGGMLVALSNARQVKKDILFSVLIAAVGVILLLSLYFRRASVFLLILAPLALGALAALTILSFGTDSISIIALSMGSVLLGVTVEYTLHIYSHVRHAPDPKTLVSDIAFPLLISCLTTVVAFLCLCLLDSPLLIDLGWFAGLSVLFAGLFSLLFIPVIARPGKSKAPSARIDSALTAIARLPLHRNGWVLAAVIAASVVFVFTFKNVKIETDLYHLSYQSAEVSQAEAELTAISSFTQRNVYAIARDSSFYTALSHMAGLAAKADSMVYEQLILPSHFIPSLVEQARRIERWNAFWTKEKQSNVLAAMAQECARLGFSSLLSEKVAAIVSKAYTPMPDSLASQLAQQVFRDLVQYRQGKYYIGALIKVQEKDKPALLSKISQLSEVFIADRSAIASHLAEYLRNDFQRLMNLSILAAFIIVFLAFGRLELTLITLLPMLVSGLWISGWMGLTGVSFNVFNLIIISLVFGLGIDYSIFVSMGMIQDRVSGGNRFGSYKTSILLSALTTLIGIGALSVARHPALQSIGTLSIIGIGSVVVISFTIQPALFRLFIPIRKHNPKTFTYTLTDILLSGISIFIFVAGCIFVSIGGLLIYLLPTRAPAKKLAYHYLIWLFASLIVYGNPQVPKRHPHRQRADFTKPAIFIANHQSYLDIMLMLSLHPRISMMTADWVQQNPFFGYIVRRAGFARASDGYEEAVRHVGQQLSEGYSVVIFPEGTRSTDQQVHRFHKGAFFLSEALKADIQPIAISGTGFMVTKGEILMRMGFVLMNYLPRQTPAMQVQAGETLIERAKRYRQLLREACVETERDFNPAGNHRRVLVRNYLYFNPALEWYVRIKSRLEQNYQPIHQLLPAQGNILDAGCGYGIMSFMLHLRAPDRVITGIDYDAKKIEVASATPLCRPGAVQFIHTNLLDYKFDRYNGIILTDVLHYLKREEQHKVLDKCLAALEPGGVLIIRDADTDSSPKHWRTKLTEYLSTRVFKFNKTATANKQLYFFSRNELVRYLTNKGMKPEIAGQSRVLSNVLITCTAKIS